MHAGPTSDLTGSLVPKQGGLGSQSYNQTLNLAASGGTLTINLTPPTGQLYRLVSIYLNPLPWPSGATGYQYFIVKVAGNQAFSFAADSANLVVSGYASQGVAGGQTWPSNDALPSAIRLLAATAKKPLQFLFTNATNTANTGILVFDVSWEVEAIDDIT